MNQEKLSPELEKILNQVKLKEPPRELVKDYVEGVNLRIDRKLRQPVFGFPQLVLAFAVGAATVGIFYWVVQGRLRPGTSEELFPMTQRVGTVVESEKAVQKPAQGKPLSLEDEMAILEAFGEDIQNGTADLVSDDEVYEEIAFLDDIELSQPASMGMSRT